MTPTYVTNVTRDAQLFRNVSWLIKVTSEDNQKDIFCIIGDSKLRRTLDVRCEFSRKFRRHFGFRGFIVLRITILIQ